MQNYVQHGDKITVPAPAEVSSGDGVLVGGIFGIAEADAASGADVVLVRRGVVTGAKVSDQVWAVGDRVYWDDGNSRFTTTPSTHQMVGLAAAAAADPTTTGTVLLPGDAPSIADGFRQAANVADASSGSAAEINALRDALVAAGLMAAAS